MFAVIRTGGKQHRVIENDRIIVERLSGEPGEQIAFDDILMLGGEGCEAMIAARVPAAARVFGQVLAQQKGDKVLVFKKRRRKNSRRLRGHRQFQTVVRITGISASGEAPALAATATEPATAAPAAAVETAEKEV